MSNMVIEWSSGRSSLTCAYIRKKQHVLFSNVVEGCSSIFMTASNSVLSECAMKHARQPCAVACSAQTAYDVSACMLHTHITGPSVVVAQDCRSLSVREA